VVSAQADTWQSAQRGRFQSAEQVRGKKPLRDDDLWRPIKRRPGLFDGRKADVGQPFQAVGRLESLPHALPKRNVSSIGLKGGLPPFVLLARRFIVGRASKAECQPIMNHPLFDGRKADVGQPFQAVGRLESLPHALPERNVSGI